MDDDVRDQDRHRCVATKRDGVRCSAKALVGDQLCFFHAPGSEAERKAAQSRGGQGNRKPSLDGVPLPRSATVNDSEFFDQLIDGVMNGRLPTKIAQVAGQLRLQRSRCNPGEMDERIAALKDAVDRLQDQKSGFDRDPEGEDWK